MKIFDKKDVCSWSNAEDAKTYIGKKGYFSNDFESMERVINSGGQTVLGRVDTNSIWCFEGLGVSLCFGLFLPADKVKEVEVEEKKYRTFTLEEFEELFKLGDVIEYRLKNRTFECYRAILVDISIYTDIIEITIGKCVYTFENLFKHYELKLNGKWKPFGVEK